MPFPLTHLCVAWRILEKTPLPEKEAAQFLLGAIAPDAIHYRKEFQSANMKNIGAAKKITHLCPVSDERWGHVTDNEGWIKIVKNFLRTSIDCKSVEISQNPFTSGYAVHVLTDIHNNRTLWLNYCANHPAEAAKGYSSDYYKDLKSIDIRLFLEHPNTTQIMNLLAKAKPEGIAELVTAEETHAIQQNILHEHFKNAETALPHSCKFITYADTLNFIEAAAEFSECQLFS
jgi:hypothetical protein